MALGLPLHRFDQQGPGGGLGLAGAIGDQLGHPLRPFRLQLRVQLLQHHALSGLQVGGGPLGDGAAHLDPGDLDLGGASLDLLATFAVGEAALVEDGPPVAPGALALGQRRLPGLQGGPADPDLLGDGLADRERLGPGRTHDGGRLGAHLGQAGGWRGRRACRRPAADHEHQGDGAHYQEGGDGEEGCDHDWSLSLRWRHLPGPPSTRAAPSASLVALALHYVGPS